MLKPRHLVILAVVVAALAAISLLQKASHQRRTSSPSTTVLLDGSWTRVGVTPPELVGRAEGLWPKIEAHLAARGVRLKHERQ